MRRAALAASRPVGEQQAYILGECIPNVDSRQFHELGEDDFAGRSKKQADVARDAVIVSVRWL